MKTSLICSFKEDKTRKVVLKDEEIEFLDNMTKKFLNKEDFINNSDYKDKIGVFMYDNSQEIEENNYTIEPYIKYRLEKSDINILKYFIDKSYLTKEKDIIYLNTIFKKDEENNEKLEKTIKEDILGKILLFKIRKLKNKYLYLRIYKDYILSKNNIYDKEQKTCNRR